MMKINWGTGIAIFYSCFVIVMVTMVVTSTQNRAQMVQDNYYEKDIHYESFRQKRQNGASYASELVFSYDATQRKLQVQFPGTLSDVHGNLTLFRPSNQYLDKVFPINLDEKGAMVVDIDPSLPAGHWRLMLDWQYRGKSYYNEDAIVL